jgi:conjugative transfer region protein (TIGR03748 family)
MHVPIVVDGIGAHRRAFLGAVLACLCLMAGCATHSATVSEPATPALSAPLVLEPISVVRQGRYTLVELTPESAQNDLLQQLVEITFPASVIHSVADAMHYLLLRSGYQTSDECETTHNFDALPLPAAHMHLGPLTLRDALRVLIGPGWHLTHDDVARTVCFAPSGDSSEPTASAAPSATLSEQSHE